MRRAWLFAPANVRRKAEGALASEADAVVLDLEDAVPAAEKVATRAALVDLAALPRRGVLVVRVNAAATTLCLRDIEAAVGANVDAIMLPKAEDAGDISSVCWALGQFEAERGRAGETELIPLIETARGLRDLDRISWGRRVRQVAFGSVDYALELGLQGDGSQAAVSHARHALVLASRAAGLLPPIDGVTLAAKDAVITRQDASLARGLGFGGKLAIHPAQVAPIQAAFQPTEKEIDWAHAVIRAFEAAEADGQGAILVRNRLVDRPILLQARQLLEQIVINVHPGT